ncbi:MAG TPA: transketolase C-terminal domain-containing protein, partial [Candidatus Paceibacterota bacterium]|nr:transketolase C-terminal domain-containing protein [Candidatus Paceibacterota bacterium]
MPDKSLNPKLFDKDVEQVPIRKGFGEGLLAQGEKDQSIVALCADLTDSTQMKMFKDKFPERFVEIGVAEQNLASVASGMAAMGKVPVISSYAMFSPGRNWEQIRTTICYNDRKVIIAGSHAGISVGPDGGTHQALEDIAITRVIPNMTVISPCDSIEAKKATMAALQSDIKTPVYIRLAREKTPVITTEASDFKIGKAQVLFDNGNAEAVIFATGALVYKALKVANELLKEGKEINVVNMATIKPLDTETIIDQVRKCGAVVTVEEHQEAGGLGSAVAEVLAQNFPVPMEFVA